MSVIRSSADSGGHAADGWGSRGRRFKSCQPDSVSPTLSARHCQPDRVMSQNICKVRTTVVGFGPCHFPGLVVLAGSMVSSRSSSLAMALTTRTRGPGGAGVRAWQAGSVITSLTPPRCASRCPVAPDVASSVVSAGRERGQLEQSYLVRRRHACGTSRKDGLLGRVPRIVWVTIRSQVRGCEQAVGDRDGSSTADS